MIYDNPSLCLNPHTLVCIRDWYSVSVATIIWVVYTENQFDPQKNKSCLANSALAMHYIQLHRRFQVTAAQFIEITLRYCRA